MELAWLLKNWKLIAGALAFIGLGIYCGVLKLENGHLSNEVGKKENLYQGEKQRADRLQTNFNVALQTNQESQATLTACQDKSKGNENAAHDLWLWATALDKKLNDLKRRPANANPNYGSVPVDDALCDGLNGLLELAGASTTGSACIDTRPAGDSHSARRAETQPGSPPAH